MNHIFSLHHNFVTLLGELFPFFKILRPWEITDMQGPLLTCGGNPMNPLLSVKSGGPFQPRVSSQCAHRQALYGPQLRPPENQRGQSSGQVLFPNIVILYLCHGMKNAGKHCSSLQGMFTALPSWHPKSTLKEEEELGMDQ